jgi:transposase
MARRYSDDLRRKLLEAHDLGKGTLAELADRFGVSLSWAWKISSARKRTGSAERKPFRPGPKVRLDREAVRRLLEAQPDLYLRELQAEFKASTGSQVSTPHLWKIVGELGFRLKTNRSTPGSATRKRTASGATSLYIGCGRLRRNGLCSWMKAESPPR